MRQRKNGIMDISKYDEFKFYASGGEAEEVYNAKDAFEHGIKLFFPGVPLNFGDYEVFYKRVNRGYSLMARQADKTKYLGLEIVTT